MKRELHQKIIDHLTEQKQRSMSGSYGCAYRGANGTMCAVGCLIPDDLYTQEMEGEPITWMLAPNHQSGYSQETVNALKELVERLELVPEDTEELKVWQGYHDRENMDYQTPGYLKWVNGEEGSMSPQEFFDKYFASKVAK